MPVNEHRFKDRVELIDVLYETFIGDIENSLERRQTATLLLSGGSTPGPLYQRLSGAKLDWSSVHVALVDERWVDVDHEASNERLLRQSLLRDQAAGAKFVAMRNGHATASAAQAGCCARYAGLPAPYSLCLLGMGADGHTASLFPAAEGLREALESRQLCAPIVANKSATTGEFVERMSMTPWGILQSEKLILLITGDDKWEVYQRARQNLAADELPVSLFIAQDEVPLEVYWAP